MHTSTQEDELGRERLETLMQMFDKAADKARGVYRRRSEVARRHADMITQNVPWTHEMRHEVNCNQVHMCTHTCQHHA